jgi:hypothetical protein
VLTHLIIRQLPLTQPIKPRLLPLIPLQRVENQVFCYSEASQHAINVGDVRQALLPCAFSFAGDDGERRLVGAFEDTDDFRSVGKVEPVEDMREMRALNAG